MLIEYDAVPLIDLDQSSEKREVFQQKSVRGFESLRNRNGNGERTFDAHACTRSTEHRAQSIV